MMKLIKKKINIEFMIVFMVILFSDVLLNFLMAPSTFSSEVLMIKALGALAVAALFPQIKQLFLMKIDPEYTIFVIMGTAVASAFAGNFLTDSIRFLQNYPNILLVEKNVVISECIKYGLFLIGLLFLLVRSIIFLITTKRQANTND